MSLVRRVGWGVADQALSSLTNFALSLLVARTVAPREFGAFALAFATYTVALGLYRALATEPLAIRYADASSDRWTRGVARATGVATAVGAVGGLGCVAAGMIAQGPFGEGLLVLGVLLPGLLLQDCWRFVFFAGRNGTAAVVNDLVWAVLLFPAMGLLLQTGRGSVAWLIFAWGAAATLAGAVGIVQAKIVPRPQDAIAWWREHRDLAARFIGEFLTISAAGQFAFYGVGAVAGLTAVGALRAGDLLLGPLQVLSLSTGLFAVPETVRILNRTPRRLPQVCLLFSSALAGVAILWGAILLVLLPSEVGEAVLGPQWSGARSVLLPLVAWRVAGEVQTGPAIGLRALAAARRGLRVRMAVAPVTVLAAIGGALLGGAALAAWGLALAGGLGAVLWWLQLSAALREHGPLSKMRRAPLAGTIGGEASSDPRALGR